MLLLLLLVLSSASDSGGLVVEATTTTTRIAEATRRRRRRSTPSTTITGWIHHNHNHHYHHRRLPCASTSTCSSHGISKQQQRSLTTTTTRRELLVPPSSLGREQQQQQPKERLRRSSFVWTMLLSSSSSSSEDIIDADIIQKDEEKHPEGETTTRTTATVSTRINEDVVVQSSQQSQQQQQFQDDNNDAGYKSLIDVSLESDRDNISTMRIPFIDLDGQSSIDVKLVFMTTVDGVSYGIGIPYDHAVAIAVEKYGQNNNKKKNQDNNKNKNDKKVEADAGGANDDDETLSKPRVTYLSPDDDDNEELMQIMATQVVEQLGDDLKLKRTPRVLTIVGPLEKYTDEWEKRIFQPNEAFHPDALMDGIINDFEHDDEKENLADIKYFHDFMKKELGEEEYYKAMSEPLDDEDRELLELFHIPGYSDNTDDVDTLNKSFFGDMLDKAKDADDVIRMELEQLRKIGSKLGYDPLDDDDLFDDICDGKHTTTATSNADTRKTTGSVATGGASTTNTNTSTNNNTNNSNRNVLMMNGNRALKLLGYVFTGDKGIGRKSYNLVKLLQPCILVARQVIEQESNDDEEFDEVVVDENNNNNNNSGIGSNSLLNKNIRFELLSNEEESIIIPKIEHVCQEELQKIGYHKNSNPITTTTQQQASQTTSSTQSTSHLQP